MARRSVLFSPGDRPEMLRKATTTDADIVVFDLEDAVAPAHKDDAREAVASVLAAVDPDCEVCVRVNPDPATAADLDAVLDDASPDSVMLPKVATAADVDRLADLLADRGLDLPVLALVETARGVLNAADIADADATDALVFGAEDLAADIGATRTPEGTEVLHAREHVRLAASAAEVDAIDTLFTDFRDAEGLAEDAAFSRDLGFDGKLAIHPDQVPVINDAFTPDPERVEWAERVVAANEEAEREGRGVFEVDGEMIDAPLLAQAERVLDRAAAADRR